MRLKQIDLFGFKSFADKVSLVPADGVTAIVGPNGSGKSNIADAVRWVLGEQSARVLRGTKMEDVIFNGSEKRRPLSYCEVSLTFDNEDHFLDIPHTEVCVSRRYNRNGDSEYLINHSPCRMRDIVSLFYDTGVGREGYSIIGQGKIEEILSNKGEERRAALEEAAGVMKYKMRREEAQRKLDRNRTLCSSGAGTHSWLSGLMKCQKCGYAITVVNKPAGMRGHYINCGGHKRGNAVCPGRGTVVTLEQIEEAVQTRLLDFLRSYRAVAPQTQRRPDARLNRLAAAIAQQEDEIGQLTRNLAHVRETDVIHIVSAQIHEANHALSELKRQRDALLYTHPQDDLEPFFQAILTEWPDYTIPEKKKIAQAAIRRVVVGDDTVEVVFRLPYGA